MKSAILSFAVVLSAVLNLAWRPMPAPFAQPIPPPNVTQQVWEATASGASTDIIVNAVGYPDLTPARNLPTKEAKTRFVVETLMHYSERAQADLLRELKARAVPHRILWVSNSVAIPAANRAMLQWLAARRDVARLDIDAKSRGIETDERLRNVVRSSSSPSPLSPAVVQWGVERVRAPEVWALGFRGQGIVVADLDTGVQWDHPALKPQYRGWNGVSGTHDYNWFDPTGKTVGLPTDDNGHGTHTTGTVIGDNGAGTQIGVAPAAAWIACRNMDSGIGSVSLYTACFQFALAPTDVTGNLPDPASGADITTNSWSCDPNYGEIGCDVPSSLVTATQALRAAGVMVVAAAGNNGPSCDKVQYAPGSYDHVFTVGATDSTNSIASFSSRGPSTFSGHVKPDLAGPGVNVYSSVPGSGYGIKSGTSMATPHVAGVVALLWSAAPGLRGDIDETEAILRRTAQPLTTAESCGGVPGTTIPNNTYGAGLIDARAAVSEAMALTLGAAIPAAHPATDVLSATVFVTNTSALTRTNLELTVSLPVSTSFVSASAGAVLSGTTVSWIFGDLVPQTDISATVVVSSDHAGLVTLTEYGLSYDGLVSRRHTAGAPVSTLVYTQRLWLVQVLR